MNLSYGPFLKSLGIKFISAGKSIVSAGFFMIQSSRGYRNTMNENGKGTSFQNAIFARNYYFQINDRMACTGRTIK
jgi:hypothetical protein